MKRLIAGLLIAVALLLGLPAGIEGVLSLRNGGFPATSVKPPDMSPSFGDPLQRDGCAGLKTGSRMWRACDTSSQIAAEYKVLAYTNQAFITPVYARTGSVDGIVLPRGATLLEHCGAANEPCEYWELVGHRGRGWLLITGASDRGRLETIRYLVDAWNRAG